MNQLEGNKNTSALFISWWYGRNFTNFLRYFKKYFVYLFDLFSVKTCLITLFAPWKRDFISTEGLSLQERFQVWTLNLTSRLVGAVIKTGTIITYLIALIASLLFIAIILLVILGFPFVILALITYGIKVLFI